VDVKHKYIPMLISEVSDDWGAGKPFQSCEAGRCALWSIEWMMKELGSMPDVLIALGGELSRWKQGGEFDKDKMDAIEKEVLV